MTEPIILKPYLLFNTLSGFNFCRLPLEKNQSVILYFISPKAEEMQCKDMELNHVIAIQNLDEFAPDMYGNNF